jgi:hypothetical protein
MKHRTTEEKLADDARLLRAWKKWHAEERAAVLAGPHGSVLAELFRMFENLRHVQPTQLIGFARAINWTAIYFDTRLVVVHELNTAITAIRESTARHRLMMACLANPTRRTPRSARSC